ncbi:ATP-binding SpoIIE family protein phosphatase [Actinoallomurus soli]|uniref:ATP-binding SpoIIE family protein phosphatase n=1 Tax=Actinoallomurus soli TaxID=2952535 RepID=UPI00209229F3|nr:SpoIIE family protein phosphatase [Actinoallomurus soli]MCO5974655.1 SpoIIE family protein phosphatase [Actinoallomurus soli]
MVTRQRPATRLAAAGLPPRLLDRHLLGIAPMAVVLLDGLGRVLRWNPAAEDVFGAPYDAVAGRPLRTLLHLPQEHRSAFEFGDRQLRHVWTGVCLVSRLDDGALREIAWWVYPLTGQGDARGLAVAADAQRIRENGHGLALGDVVVTPPPPTPLTATSGVRILRVEPTLVQSSTVDSALLRRRLAELLPPDLDRPQIADQVLARGYPAVNVSVTVRLPFAGHRGTAPRARRVRSTAPSPIAPAQIVPAPTSPADAGVAPYAPYAPYDPSPAEALEHLAAQERLDFLNHVGARLADTLDPVQTAQVLCDALVPSFADFAGVQLLESIVSDQELPPAEADASPSLVRVAMRYDEEDGHWDDLVPLGELIRMPSRTSLAGDLTTGQSINVARISDRVSRRISSHVGGRDLRPLLRGRALLVTPLIARGKVLGTIFLLRRRDRPPFGEPEVAVAEELGRRAAVCVDNGRLYRREARVAAQLQHSMLPDAPPVVAGARICYRYVPADEAVRVGGDWFDAIPLPGSRLALVVGDVMGHGLTSAAIMGQLRTAVRTLAPQDLPPDQLLRQLDDLARRLGDECLATCIYAVYDPVARRCEIANAGHLPPVLVSPSGESWLLEVPPGAPIGVGGVAFETVSFDVEDGSQFVLCTDGLVERRGRPLDVGLTAMREFLSGPPRPLEDVCETLIEGFSTAGRHDDDIALLAVRFEGIPKADVFACTLRAEPAVVRETRRLARRALETWGLHALVPTVELLVSELVTNAVVHGAGDLGLRLIRANALLCEVRDDGYDLPHLRRAETTDENGRGLQLVSALAEHWGTQRTPTGKVVWFEHPL